MCIRDRVRTIQNEPPSGICGTGAIETLYELLQAGLVDETGLLEEDYEEDGFELAKGRDGEMCIRDSIFLYSGASAVYCIHGPCAAVFSYPAGTAGTVGGYKPCRNNAHRFH